MDAYGRFSDVYDRLLYDAPGEKWSSYLLPLLNVPAPARVLDYACGSGRMSTELARAGYEVIGIDRSAQMLMRAQEKLRPFRERCHLVKADMTAFSMERPADAALCALDGVNYLVTGGALAAFFASAAANLKEGAPFLFDISSSYKLENILAEEIFFDDGEEETLLWTNAYDPPSRLLEMSLTVFARQGGLYERFDELHVIRAWREEEIVRALETAGFYDIGVFAFGTPDAPAAQSERIQFRARKGENR